MHEPEKRWKGWKSARAGYDSASLAHTFLSLLYTLPGGEPMMRWQMASRATRMFWKDPSRWTLVSASTMRVRVAFSMVNFVLPFLPEHVQVGTVITMRDEPSAPLPQSSWNRAELPLFTANYTAHPRA